MQNPKNSQRQTSLSVPQGAAAFATRRRTRHGPFASSEPHRKTKSLPTGTSNNMKATSNSRSKTAQSAPITKARSTEGDGQLFLGHKVLGELRILMRLATPTANPHETSGSNGSHRSF
jgi:hypothetical protein